MHLVLTRPAVVNDTPTFFINNAASSDLTVHCDDGSLLCKRKFGSAAEKKRKALYGVVAADA